MSQSITYDDQGRSKCGKCGKFLVEIGDVLPVHVCKRKEERIVHDISSQRSGRDPRRG